MPSYTNMDELEKKDQYYRNWYVEDENSHATDDTKEQSTKPKGRRFVKGMKKIAKRVSKNINNPKNKSAFSSSHRETYVEHLTPFDEPPVSNHHNPILSTDKKRLSIPRQTPPTFPMHQDFEKYSENRMNDSDSASVNSADNGSTSSVLSTNHHDSPIRKTLFSDALALYHQLELVVSDSSSPPPSSFRSVVVGDGEHQDKEEDASVVARLVQEQDRGTLRDDTSSITQLPSLFDPLMAESDTDINMMKPHEEGCVRQCNYKDPELALEEQEQKFMLQEQKTRRKIQALQQQKARANDFVESPVGVNYRSYLLGNSQGDDEGSLRDGRNLILLDDSVSLDTGTWKDWPKTEKQHCNEAASPDSVPTVDHLRQELSLTLEKEAEAFQNVSDPGCSEGSSEDAIEVSPCGEANNGAVSITVHCADRGIIQSPGDTSNVGDPSLLFFSSSSSSSSGNSFRDGDDAEVVDKESSMTGKEKFSESKPTQPSRVSKPMSDVDPYPPVLEETLKKSTGAPASENSNTAEETIRSMEARPSVGKGKLVDTERRSNLSCFGAARNDTKHIAPPRKELAQAGAAVSKAILSDNDLPKPTDESSESTPSSVEGSSMDQSVDYATDMSVKMRPEDESVATFIAAKWEDTSSIAATRYGCATDAGYATDAAVYPYTAEGDDSATDAGYATDAAVDAVTHENSITAGQDSTTADTNGVAATSKTSRGRRRHRRRQVRNAQQKNMNNIQNSCVHNTSNRSHVQPLCTFPVHATTPVRSPTRNEMPIHECYSADESTRAEPIRTTKKIGPSSTLARESYSADEATKDVPIETSEKTSQFSLPPPTASPEPDGNSVASRNTVSKIKQMFELGGKAPPRSKSEPPMAARKRFSYKPREGIIVDSRMVAANAGTDDSLSSLVQNTSPKKSSGASLLLKSVDPGKYSEGKSVEVRSCPQDWRADKVFGVERSSPLKKYIAAASNSARSDSVTTRKSFQSQKTVPLKVPPLKNKSPCQRSCTDGFKSKRGFFNFNDDTSLFGSLQSVAVSSPIRKLSEHDVKQPPAEKMNESKCSPVTQRDDQEDSSQLGKQMLPLSRKILHDIVNYGKSVPRFRKRSYMGSDTASSTSSHNGYDERGNRAKECEWKLMPESKSKQYGKEINYEFNGILERETGKGEVLQVMASEADKEAKPMMNSTNECNHKLTNNNGVAEDSKVASSMNKDGKDLLTQPLLPLVSSTSFQESHAGIKHVSVTSRCEVEEGCKKEGFIFKEEIQEISEAPSSQAVDSSSSNENDFYGQDFVEANATVICDEEQWKPCCIQDIVSDASVITDKPAVSPIAEVEAIASRGDVSRQLDILFGEFTVPDTSFEAIESEVFDLKVEADNHLITDLDWDEVLDDLLADILSDKNSVPQTTDASESNASGESCSPIIGPKGVNFTHGIHIADEASLLLRSGTISRPEEAARTKNLGAQSSNEVCSQAGTLYFSPTDVDNSRNSFVSESYSAEIVQANALTDSDALSPAVDKKSSGSYMDVEWSRVPRQTSLEPLEIYSMKSAHTCPESKRMRPDQKLLNLSPKGDDCVTSSDEKDDEVGSSSGWHYNGTSVMEKGATEFESLTIENADPLPDAGVSEREALLDTNSNIEHSTSAPLDLSAEKPAVAPTLDSEGSGDDSWFEKGKSDKIENISSNSIDDTSFDEGRPPQGVVELLSGASVQGETKEYRNCGAVKAEYIDLEDDTSTSFEKAPASAVSEFDIGHAAKAEAFESLEESSSRSTANEENLTVSLESKPLDANDDKNLATLPITKFDTGQAAEKCSIDRPPDSPEVATLLSNPAASTFLQYQDVPVSALIKNAVESSSGVFFESCITGSSSYNPLPGIFTRPGIENFDQGMNWNDSEPCSAQDIKNESLIASLTCVIDQETSGSRSRESAVGLAPTEITDMIHNGVSQDTSNSETSDFDPECVKEGNYDQMFLINHEGELESFKDSHTSSASRDPDRQPKEVFYSASVEKSVSYTLEDDRVEVDSEYSSDGDIGGFSQNEVMPASAIISTDIKLGCSKYTPNTCPNGKDLEETKTIEQSDTTSASSCLSSSSRQGAQLSSKENGNDVASSAGSRFLDEVMSIVSNDGSTGREGSSTLQTFVNYAFKHDGHTHSPMAESESIRDCIQEPKISLGARSEDDKGEQDTEDNAAQHEASSEQIRGSISASVWSSSGETSSWSDTDDESFINRVLSAIRNEEALQPTTEHDKSTIKEGGVSTEQKAPEKTMQNTTSARDRRNRLRGSCTVIPGSAGDQSSEDSGCVEVVCSKHSNPVYSSTSSPAAENMDTKNNQLITTRDNFESVYAASTSEDGEESRKSEKLPDTHPHRSFDDSNNFRRPSFDSSFTAINKSDSFGAWSAPADFPCQSPSQQKEQHSDVAQLYSHDFFADESFTMCEAREERKLLDDNRGRAMANWSTEMSPSKSTRSQLADDDSTDDEVDDLLQELVNFKSRIFRSTSRHVVTATSETLRGGFEKVKTARTDEKSLTPFEEELRRFKTKLNSTSEKSETSPQRHHMKRTLSTPKMEAVSVPVLASLNESEESGNSEKVRDLLRQARNSTKHSHLKYLNPGQRSFSYAYGEDENDTSAVGENTEQLTIAPVFPTQTDSAASKQAVPLSKEEFPVYSYKHDADAVIEDAEQRMLALELPFCRTQTDSAPSKQPAPPSKEEFSVNSDKSDADAVVENAGQLAIAQELPFYPIEADSTAASKQAAPFSKEKNSQNCQQCRKLQPSGSKIDAAEAQILESSETATEGEDNALNIRGLDPPQKRPVLEDMSTRISSRLASTPNEIYGQVVKKANLLAQLQRLTSPTDHLLSVETRIKKYEGFIDDPSAISVLSVECEREQEDEANKAYHGEEEGSNCGDSASESLSLVYSIDASISLSSTIKTEDTYFNYFLPNVLSRPRHHNNHQYRSDRAMSISEEKNLGTIAEAPGADRRADHEGMVALPTTNQEVNSRLREYRTDTAGENLADSQNFMHSIHHADASSVVSSIRMFNEPKRAITQPTVLKTPSKSVTFQEDVGRLSKDAVSMYDIDEDANSILERSPPQPPPPETPVRPTSPLSPNSKKLLLLGLPVPDELHPDIPIGATLKGIKDAVGDTFTQTMKESWHRLPPLFEESREPPFVPPSDQRENTSNSMQFDDVECTLSLFGPHGPGDHSVSSKATEDQSMPSRNMDDQSVPCDLQRLDESTIEQAESAAESAIKRISDQVEEGQFGMNARANKMEQVHLGSKGATEDRSIAVKYPGRSLPSQTGLASPPNTIQVEPKKRNKSR